MADLLALPPRRLLRDEAYTVIRAAIVEGDLAPGEVVRDIELATRLGLSRTPVREALSRLTDEGLIESKPHAFTRVTPLLRQATHDAFQVVSAMHQLAVSLAVPRMAGADIDELTRLNADFAAALDAGDVPAALAADDAFHDVFIAVAGNRAVADTIERFSPLIRRLERLRFGSLPGKHSVRVHAAMVKAAAAGDVATATALTEQNWSALGEEIDRAFAAPASGPAASD